MRIKQWRIFDGCFTAGLFLYILGRACAGRSPVPGVQVAATWGALLFILPAVAALAADSPVGVIFAGIVFGALRAGTMELNRTTSIPVEFVNVIQAMVVILVAAPLLVKELKRLNPAGWSRKTKKEVA